ncbi:MAG: hypothetical protein M3O34_01390 [Chloroflexota bacterium]|nr:hypothetical protein [Chloroflexota bacterium]
MSERLEIRPGAEVFGAEGVIGRVIVSPVSREVTALEVTRPLQPAVVLPIEAVKGADPDRPQTDLSSADLDALPVWGMRLHRPAGRLAVAHRHPAEHDFFPALEAGAPGYLPKHSAPDDVLMSLDEQAR